MPEQKWSSIYYEVSFFSILFHFVVFWRIYVIDMELWWPWFIYIDLYVFPVARLEKESSSACVWMPLNYNPIYCSLKQEQVLGHDIINWMYSRPIYG